MTTRSFPLAVVGAGPLRAQYNGRRGWEIARHSFGRVMLLLVQLDDGPAV